jgi:hypothetical protein
LEQHIGYFCLQKEILSLTVVDPHLSFQQKNHNVRESLGETTKTQEKNSIPLSGTMIMDSATDITVQDQIVHKIVGHTAI